MRIALAADELTGVAEALPDELRRRGHEPIAHGAYAEGERDDWAWCSEAAARDVAEGRAEQAVVACWTGTGASIAANKVAGIRAALCADAQTADGARRWNDANVLAISLRATSHAQLGRSSMHGSRAPRARTATTSRTSTTWARSSGPSRSRSLAPTARIGCRKRQRTARRAGSGGRCGEIAHVRNSSLHDALAEFATDAAGRLQDETAAGAEIPFEVVSTPRRARSSPLYCYRPLTGAFIRERLGLLSALPSYAPAARALTLLDGVDAYLTLRGESRIPADPRERADAALRVFLASVFEERSEFGFDERALRGVLRRARARRVRGPGDKRRDRAPARDRARREHRRAAARRRGGARARRDAPRRATGGESGATGRTPTCSRC